MERRQTHLDRTAICVVALLAVASHPLLAQTHNYSEAFQKALFFYEVQTSGEIPLDHRAEWRGDSALRDGSDVGRDLTGGWYDAGDGVVWTGNEGFGATMLAWSLYNYRDIYMSTGQYQIAIDRVREISDYLEKVVQLDGSGNIERIYCGKGAIKNAPPDNPAADNDRTEGCPNEVMDTIVGGAPQALRPSFWVDATTGGADVAGAVAAGLASCSIVLRDSGDTARADELLALAKKACAWGEANPNLELNIGGTTTRTATRRMTNGSPVTISDYSNRTSEWTPRMMFAAAWLHRADLAAATPGYTDAWIDKAETIYQSAANDSKRSKHWANFASGSEQNGAYAMLAADSGRSVFVAEANAYANFWLYDRSNHTGRTTDPTTTPDGFVCRGQGAAWNVHTLLDQAPPLLDWADSPHNTNTTQKAHLDALYTDTYNNGHNECPTKQIDYILGSNTAKRSYLQGYKPSGTGYDWVKNLWHRPTAWAYGGFGTDAADKPEWNRFTAYGTLCPGPDKTDFYPAAKKLTESLEIAYQEPIIYTGGLLTVLARNIAEGGPSAGAVLPTFPVWETRPATYQTESFFVRASKDSATRLQCYLNNRAMFPPREIDTLGFRYYFTPDGVAGSAVTCTATGSGLLSGESVVVSGPFQVGTSSTWHFEIRLVSAMIVPGEYKRHQRKVQLDFAQSSGTFDPANDHSGAAITGTEATIANLPVYDTSGGTGNWKLLGGFEPSAGYIQWRRAHFNNVMESASEVVLIAERVGGTAGAVGARVTLAPGTAGLGDYSAPASATLAGADGESGEKTFPIPLTDDSFDEGREYFTATLGTFTGGAAAGLLTDTRVSIEDDDAGGAPDPNVLVQILGNNRVIAAGDTSPSPDDGTDFGSATTAEESTLRTFTIKNLDSSALSLTGYPTVTITGTHAADFSVTSAPATSVAPDGATSFQVTFSPSANGERTATITVANNKSTSGNYTFAIKGSGIGAAPSGSLTPGAVSRELTPGGGTPGSATQAITLANSGRAGLPWTASFPSNYEVITSTSPFGPIYNWIDITSAGENQGAVADFGIASYWDVDDSMSQIVNIGFDFPFYGVKYSSLKICSNGFLALDTSGNFVEPYNRQLPTSYVAAQIIAAWWDDLYLRANVGKVYYKRVDADTFVITYHNVAYWTATSVRMNFQIILKRNGQIVMQYQNVLTSPNNNGYTIGIQASKTDPARAVQYAYNTKTAENGIAIEFRPPPGGNYDVTGTTGNWATVSPGSGTAGALGSSTINLALNTTGLQSGQSYPTQLTVNTPDDLLHPTRTVPVTLTATRSYNLAAAGTANRAWETNANWSPNSAFPGPNDTLNLTTAGGSLRIDGPRTIRALTLDHASGLTLNGTGFGGSGTGATLATTGLVTVNQGALLAGASSAKLQLDGGLTLSGGTFGFASGATGAIAVANDAPITLAGGILDTVVNTSGTIYRMALGSGDLALTGIAPEIRVGEDTFTLDRRLTGAGGFKKTGAGILLLNGPAANNTGVVEIAAGTLKLGANNSIGNEAGLRLSGGTLATNGKSLTAATLDLAASATIDFSGGGSLAFGDSSAISWAGASLAIINFTPGADSLRFGSGNSALTPAQLAKITINGQPALINSQGQIGLASNYAWNADASGTWSTTANWDPNDGFPNATDATATFGALITAARTITLDQNISLGTLAFNEDGVAANAYTVGFDAGVRLTFDVDSGTATLNARGTGGYAVGTQGQGQITLADTVAISAGSSGAATSDGGTVCLNSQLTGAGGLVLSSLNSTDGSGTAVHGARGTFLRSTVANTFSGGVTVNSGYLGISGNIGNLGSGTLTLNASDSSNGGIGTNLSLRTGGGTLVNAIVLGNPSATGGGNPRLQIALGDSSQQSYTFTGGISGDLGNQTLRFQTYGSGVNTSSSLTLSGDSSGLAIGTGGTVFIRTGSITLDHAHAFGTNNTVGNGTSGGWQLGNFSNGASGTTRLLTNGHNVGGRITTSQTTSSGQTSNDTLVLGGNHTSGSATFSGNITLGRIVGGTRKLQLTSASGGTTVFTGTISDGSASGSANTVVPVEITGAGTVLLDGNNTYTGSTTVASGATLGGTGTITGPLTIADGGRLAFTLTTAPASHDRLDVGPVTLSGVSSVVIAASGSVPATGTYLLLRSTATLSGALPSLTLPDGYVGTLAFSDTDLVLTLTQVPFANWAAEAGLSGNDALATDDPDADGLANLLEYAFQKDPTDPSDPTDLLALGTSGDHLTLTFTPQRVSGLRYIIEASSDLSDWSDQTDITALLTPGEPYTHTDSEVMGTRRFLRLRVTAP